MKSILLALLSASLFFAPKGKPEIKINPAYLGTYYIVDTPTAKPWILKSVSFATNKIGFFQNAKDTDALFIVTMKDSTHFKTPGEFAQNTPGQVTRYWSAKGEFLPGGKMELAVHSSDVSSSLKLSFSVEADEKVLYVKK
jgi:hypothetical protein